MKGSREQELGDFRVKGEKRGREPRWGKTPGCPFGAGLTGRVEECRSSWHRWSPLVSEP